MSGRPDGEDRSLRGQVYRSGRLLVARQLCSMGLRVAGILVISRLIGPTAYGLFAAAAAIAAVLSTVAVFGIDVHLVRTEPAGTDAEDTAFAVLVLSSVGVGAVALLAAPLLGSWLGSAEAVGPMRVMAALLPVMVLWVPARARLERRLRFGALAIIELSADLIVYAVAVPLAIAGAGVWAPVAGFGARHGLLLIATNLVAGYRPNPVLDRREAAAIVRFGSGYSAGKWVSVCGQLVNPIIVGRLLGPTGVGYVALATRIIEQLGAVKQATMRLATAALGRLDGDRERLRRAHGEGILVQVLGAVPLYAVATFLAPWLLPALFGAEWEPTVRLLALLAISASVGTLFNLHAPTLRVLHRNAPVARLRLFQVATLAGLSSVLVPWLGLTGYGWARVARAVPFALIDRDLRAVFEPSYRAGVRWLLGLLPMMAAPWVGATARPLLLVPLVVLLATPSARADLRLVAGRALNPA